MLTTIHDLNTIIEFDLSHIMVAVYVLVDKIVFYIFVDKTLSYILVERDKLYHENESKSFTCSTNTKNSDDWPKISKF